MDICECGCGEQPSPGKRFIAYHNLRTPETEERRVAALRSPEVRAKMSAAKKGICRPVETYLHGENHHNFTTGEYAGTAKGEYVKDHLWLRRHHGHEKLTAACENCGTPNRQIVTKAGWSKSSLQFSYLGEPGESSRCREDYVLLCPRCHAEKDSEQRAAHPLENRVTERAGT